MKKGQIFFLAAIFIFAGSHTKAMQNSRLEWWKLHRAELNKEIVEAKNEKRLDGEIEVLLRKEVKRSNDVIGIFEKHALNEGLLTQTGKEFSPSSYRSILLKKASVAADLLLMKNLVLTWNSGEISEMMLKQAGKRVAGYAAEKFTAETDELAELFVTRDIPRDKRRRIAREMLMEAMMRQRVKLKETIEKKLSERIGERFGYKKTVTSSHLNRSIIEETEKLIAEYLMPMEVAFTENDLMRSVTWNYYEAVMKHRFRVFSEIQKMMKEEFPLGKIRYFYRDPLAMDARYFPQLPISKDKQENSRIYFNRNIDSLRRRYLGQVSSRNVSVITRRFLKKADSYVNQYLARERASLLYAEKTLKRLQETDNSDPVQKGALGKAIAIKRSDITKMKTDAEEYVNRSEKLLLWRGDNVAMPQPVMKGVVNELISGQGKYIIFIGNIGRGAVQLAARRGGSAHDVRTSLRRLDKVYRDILEGILPGKEIRKSLTQRDVAAFKNQKRILTNEVKGMHSSLIADYRLVRENHGSMKEKDDTRRGNGDISIAQFEMDQIAEGLRDFNRALARYTYAEELLARYKLTADRFIAALKKGDIPPETEKIISKKSLFPFIKNYDAGKFRREEFTKKYLVRKMQQRESRIKGLLYYYKRRGIEIREYPDADELKACHRDWSRRPVITVGGRRIDPSTLLMGDVSTARYVRDLTVKNLWKEDNKDVFPEPTAGLNWKIGVYR